VFSVFGIVNKTSTEASLAPGIARLVVLALYWYKRMYALPLDSVHYFGIIEEVQRLSENIPWHIFSMGLIMGVGSQWKNKIFFCCQFG
jgi:hypothetical protein